MFKSDRGHTVGQHSFAMVPSVSVPRSVFDRSCGMKTSFNAGDLIIIFADEALPGDTFTLSMDGFVRVNAFQRVPMENIYVDYFFFFVPNRLLWDNWVKMCGEQRNPGDSTSFLVPVITPPAGGWITRSVADYLGWPLGVANGIANCSALWHRAYNSIWNEWFRDENLQNSVATNTGDGPDAATDYAILKRGKRHDYFTSCLPFPQKGTAVALPLGTTAPVIGVNDTPPIFRVIGNATNLTLRGVNTNSAPQWDVAATATGSVEWQQTGLVADLATATAATINQIREAFQIQRMFERDARGGTRYTEILRSHFGVISPDGRLQRPEYLGGGTSRVNIHSVAGTAATNTADIGSWATSSVTGVGFRKSFTEHGVILGLCAARADITYQDGVDRMFSRRTRFDFYWPSLAFLGEQAVLNKEIYADGSANDNLIFGYQERYAEYRYKPSHVTGIQRASTVSGPTAIPVYNLALDFTALPVLNASFIVENPPMDRILKTATNTADNYFADFYFNFKCARPMPTYGVPGLIDHF